MFCGKCGLPIQEDALFCGECGAPNIDVGKREVAITSTSEIEGYPPPVRPIQPSQPSFDVNNLIAKLKANPLATKIGIGVIALIVVLFISKSIYNSSHSQTKITNELSKDIMAHNSTAVASLVKTKTGQPLSPAAAESFVDYYSKNLGAFQAGLSQLNGSFSSNNGYSWSVSSTLGFKKYSLVVPTNQLMVKAIKGSTFQIGTSNNAQGTGDLQPIGEFVSGVPVHVVATLKTNWGDITDARDIQAGQNTEFTFPDGAYFNVNTQPFPKGTTIQINGKDSQFKTGDNQSIGPLPKNNNYTFSVIAKYPFGSLTFSANSNISNTWGAMELKPDPASAKPILQAIGDVIDKFNAADLTPGGNSTSYIQPNSPEAQRYTPTYVAFPQLKSTYLKMQLYANSLHVDKTYDGKPVVIVQTAESYMNNGNRNDQNDIYTMIWDDSGKWLVYDYSSTYSRVTASSNDLLYDHGGATTSNQTSLLPVSSVNASSTLASQPPYDYSPKNVIDNDLSTSWVEGVDGDGVGEWISLTVPKASHISAVGIVNGYHRDKSIYQENNRVSKVKLEFSDGTSVVKDLNDSYESGEQVLQLDKEVISDSVKVTILGVYKGDKYSDTCISEIKVYGYQ